MTDVNTLNAETRLKDQLTKTNDHMVALLVAVYKLPLEQRKIVLEQYEKNKNAMEVERFGQYMKGEYPQKKECEVCNGDGFIDIDGDAGELGWDKIGEKACPVCYPPYENPIQD